MCRQFGGLFALCLIACGPTDPPLATVAAKKVQLGVGFACALTAGGKVRCWGQASTNTTGGDGMAYHFGSQAVTGERTTPVEVAGVSNISDLSIDYSHVCALTAEKKVICWGRNAEGQIGNGNDDNLTAPFELPLSNVKKVRAGSYHTCALLEDGTVKCWGSNSDNQLEGIPVSVNADRWAPLTVPNVTNATDLIVSGRTSCAVMSGKPRCWGVRVPTAGGAMSNDPPPWLLNVTGVTDLTLGTDQVCGIVSGAAKCWGVADKGNLGTGADTGDPEQPMPANVRGLDSGVTSLQNGCATANGKVSCWGSWPETFGDGTDKAKSLLPVQASGISDAVQVSSAFGTTCAVTSGGSVFCWGAGIQGQLGIGKTTPTPALTPQKVATFQ